MYSRESSGHAVSVKNEQIHTLHQTFGLLDCKSLSPSPISGLQSAPAAVDAEIRFDIHTHDHVQRLIVKDISRKVEKSSHQAQQETMMLSVSDLFITGHIELKED